MKFLTLDQARADLANIVSNVRLTNERTVITKRGKPAVVILSAEDYEDLQDELEIMRDPELYKLLVEGYPEEDKYHSYTETDVREMVEMRKAGHVFTDEENEEIARRVIERNRALAEGDCRG